MGKDHGRMWRKHKKIKHYAIAGEARELTFSCHQRAPVFEAPECCALLTRWINDALAACPYDLLAFVYMPDHVHLLVMPHTDGSDIDALLWRIKQRSALAIHRHLKQSGDEELLEKLRYLGPTGVPTFRLWQAGPGFDRNVDKPRILSAMIDYIHHNPVRKALCANPDEYRWSSWAQIHTPDLPHNPNVPKITWPEGLIL